MSILLGGSILYLIIGVVFAILFTRSTPEWYRRPSEIFYVILVAALWFPFLCIELYEIISY